MTFKTLCVWQCGVCVAAQCGVCVSQCAFLRTGAVVVGTAVDHEMGDPAFLAGRDVVVAKGTPGEALGVLGDATVAGSNVGRVVCVVDGLFASWADLVRATLLTLVQQVVVQRRNLHRFFAGRTRGEDRAVLKVVHVQLALGKGRVLLPTKDTGLVNVPIVGIQLLVDLV